MYFGKVLEQMFNCPEMVLMDLLSSSRSFSYDAREVEVDMTMTYD